MKAQTGCWLAAFVLGLVFSFSDCKGGKGGLGKLGHDDNEDGGLEENQVEEAIPEEPPLGNLGTLAQDLGDELCNAMQGCGLLATGKLETCRETIRLYYQGYQDQLEAHVATGMYEYQQENMGMCISALSSRVCNRGYVAGERFCDDRAFLTTLQPAGSACLEGFCSEGEYCTGPQDLHPSGLCQPLKQETEACNDDGECDYRTADLRCKRPLTGGEGACTPLTVVGPDGDCSDEGSVCDFGMACVQWFNEELTRFVYTCRAPLGESETCGFVGNAAPDEDPCAIGLKCEMDNDLESCWPLGDIDGGCPCKIGTDCLDETCLAQGGLGDPCSPDPATGVTNCFNADPYGELGCNITQPNPAMGICIAGSVTD